MSAQPGWVAGRVDVLLAGQGDLGMSMSRTAAAELVHERVLWVSSQVGISTAAARRHLSPTTLVCLARTMVISFADETPGAVVIASRPTSPGRSSAAVSPAWPGRSRYAWRERDTVEHLRSTAHALSALGQVAPEAGCEPAARLARAATVRKSS